MWYLLSLIFSAILKDDIKLMLERFVRFNLRRAAMRLPEESADRYLEEWLAHSEQIGYLVGRLVHALSLRFWGAPQMVSVLAKDNSMKVEAEATLLRRMDIILSMLLLPPVLVVLTFVSLVFIVLGERNFIRTHSVKYREGHNVRVTRFNTSYSDLDTPTLRGFKSFLKKSNLEEMPMLANVLRGDLSIVGASLQTVDVQSSEAWIGCRPGIVPFPADERLTLVLYFKALLNVTLAVLGRCLSK